MTSCCSFNAARLRHHIHIERVTRTPDGMGGFTEVWAADPAEGIWAELKFLTGTERWEAAAVHQGNLGRATIRWRGTAEGTPYYTAADRLIWRTQEFAILAVHPVDFAQSWLQLEIMQGRAT